jgi:regulator of cell morphogenesis and NO signaling
MNSLTYADFIAENRLLESVVERLEVPRYMWDSPIGNSNYTAEHVVAILKAFDEHEKFPLEQLMMLPIESVLNYLRATHAYYLNKKLPEIELSFANLLVDYKHTHPELVRISSLFIDYKSELTKHIIEEETTLFKYIDLLILSEHDKNIKSKLRKPPYLKFSIAKFEESHENVEKSLSNIRELILEYAPIATSVMPFRMFLLQMEFFEKDLNRHGLMEDLVLIPKATVLESLLK